MVTTHHPTNTVCPTTATHSRTDWGFLLIAVLLSGCGARDPLPSADVLIYCPATLNPLAEQIVGRISAGSDVNVRLAPVRPSHLVSTVTGLRRGDFVICLEGKTAAALIDEGLVERSYQLGLLELGVAARSDAAPRSLSALGASLGAGRRDGAMGIALESALPNPLRAQVAANIKYRSGRPDELARLIDLGGLDAAFLWTTTALPDGVSFLRIPELKTSRCALLLLQLTCSHQPKQTLARMDELLSRGKRWLAPTSASPDSGGAANGE